MGQYSCGYVQEYCGGSSVINKAIGGTTAKQWGDPADSKVEDAFNGQASSQLQPTMPWRTANQRLPRTAHARATVATPHNPRQAGITHVWISLLGNDYFGQCSLTADDLFALLDKAYLKIKAGAEAAGNSGPCWVVRCGEGAWCERDMVRGRRRVVRCPPALL